MARLSKIELDGANFVRARSDRAFDGKNAASVFSACFSCVFQSSRTRSEAEKGKLGRGVAPHAAVLAAIRAADLAVYCHEPPPLSQWSSPHNSGQADGGVAQHRRHPQGRLPGQAGFVRRSSDGLHRLHLCISPKARILLWKRLPTLPFRSCQRKVQAAKEASYLTCADKQTPDRTADANAALAPATSFVNRLRRATSTPSLSLSTIFSCRAKMFVICCFHFRKARKGQDCGRRASSPFLLMRHE